MNNKVEASPEVKGGVLYCPACGGDVIAKTGEINIHHFAHVTKDCGYFDYKGMSEWHTKWQDLFPPEKQEVRIEKEGKVHIADVVNSNGVVIEFQHSTMSLESKMKRDAFYDKLVWVVDARDFIENLEISNTYIPTKEFITWQNKVREWEDEVVYEDDKNQEIDRSLNKLKDELWNIGTLGALNNTEINSVLNWLYPTVNNRKYKGAKNSKPTKFSGKKWGKIEYKLYWKWERKMWRDIKCESENVLVFLDLGNGEMYLLYNQSKKVKKVTKEAFIKRYCH
jgi:competence CoiA-like predicted nuclease